MSPMPAEPKSFGANWAWSARGALVIMALVIGALFTAVVLAGCESLNPESGHPISPPETVQTEVTGMRSFAAGWGGEARGFWLVSMAVQAPQVDPLAEPSHQGYVVVYCVVEIANGGDRPFEYSQDDFTLLGQDASSDGGGADGSVLTVSEPPLMPEGAATLAPGETIRGAVAFEFSPEAVSTIYELRFSHLHSPGVWDAKWGDEYQR